MDCSKPNGPCTLGPGRCCRRPITLRSNQTANSTDTSKNTSTSTALMMTIQIESPASELSNAVMHFACVSEILVGSVTPQYSWPLVNATTGAATGIGVGETA